MRMGRAAYSEASEGRERGRGLSQRSAGWLATSDQRGRDRARACVLRLLCSPPPLGDWEGGVGSLGLQVLQNYSEDTPKMMIKSYPGVTCCL